MEAYAFLILSMPATHSHTNKMHVFAQIAMETICKQISTIAMIVNCAHLPSVSS